MDKYEKKLTQSAIMARGWSKGMIKELLPEPETRANPRYKNGAEMKLWPESEVEKAETTPEFKQRKEEYERRKTSAAKGIITKREVTKANLLNIAEQITIDVEPIHVIRKKAIDYIARREEYYGRDDAMPGSAPEEVIKRWMVNHIRHHCTLYGLALYGQKGRVGVDTAYPPYKCAVLDKIAAAYPELAEECENQKKRLPPT
ncbi:MAG: hypothetical protein IJQ32_01060 [Paludibacteraceae bacterium]|nr:hypothetical protein [Paludibacteraceae bacterium]